MSSKHPNAFCWTFLFLRAFIAGIAVAAVGILLAAMMDGTSPAAFINMPAIILIIAGTGGVTLASVGMDGVKKIPSLYKLVIRADLVVIVMSYHDVYWIDEKEGWPQIDTDGFLKSLKAAIKPGGKLLIIDHNAAAGTGKEAAGKLHRLNEEWSKKSLTSAGFTFVKSYDGLRNPNDQLDKMVFDPAVKGKTDRYCDLYTVK